MKMKKTCYMKQHKHTAKHNVEEKKSDTNEYTFYIPVTFLKYKGNSLMV